MEAWHLIITPKLSGEQNMQSDLKMFEDFEKDNISSTLRIYSWKPKCISLGYSQDAGGLVDGLMAKEKGWDIVKRPTGGGIVFHNEAEVTYSLVTAIDNPVLPKGLVPSYKKISEAVVFGLKVLNIKAKVKATRDSRPATRDSLCFSYPAEYEIVADGKKIVGSAQKRGKKALLQQGSIKISRVVGFEKMAQALKQGFEERLGVKFKI